MTPFVAAALFALALWWLGTGLVLHLQQRLQLQVRPRRTALAVAIAALGALATLALVLVAGRTGALASLAGFTAAIVLWGALELSHLLGLVTGTHAAPCPADTGARERFRLALGASLWHELSVLAAGLLLVVLLLPAANPTGPYAFVVLWLMRWSAKLNLFFGVPNFSTEWFPERLAHVASYIRHAPVSAFYPISVTLAVLAFIALARLALAAPASDALVHALPAALLLLALVEHLFMVLPVADTRLWNRIFAIAPAARDDSGPAARRDATRAREPIAPPAARAR